MDRLTSEAALFDRLWPRFLARRTVEQPPRVGLFDFAQALLDELGEPLMSSTLILRGNEIPETDAEDIRARLERELDLIIDGGPCGLEFTTVVDLTESVPQLIRYGKGSTEGLT